VYEAFYNIGEKDFTPILTAIKQSGANAMLNDMRLGDYITMHRQYTTLGLCHLVVSYGPRGPEGRAISELGKAAENVFGVQWWNLLASIKNLALTTIEMLKQEIDAGKLPKPLKIATVNENTDHGREYLAGLKEGARKYPGYFEIVYEAFYNIGEKASHYSGEGPPDPRGLQHTARPGTGRPSSSRGSLRRRRSSSERFCR
jgi:hypothetical protein